MRFEVHLNGKNAIDSVHGFKGALQSAIRRSGNYPNARLTANKQGRTIKVQNVDRGFIEENLRKIQSTKVAFKGVDFDIEEIHEREKEPKPDKSAEKKFAHWIENTQREFQKKEKRFRQDIERLEKEKKQLAKERDALVTLRHEDEKKYSDLQRSHETVSRMVDSLAEGRVRSPSQACCDWVGDWMVTGQDLENRIEESVGDVEPYELEDLMSRPKASVLEKASRELGLELASVEDLASLTGGKKWEETDFYERYQENYARALEEMDFLEDVDSGEIKLPSSVADELTDRIDEDKNRKAIASYLARRGEFEEKSEKAEMAALYLEEIQNVENVKALAMETKDLKSLPVAIVVSNEGKKWFCEVVYPSGEEEGLVQKVLDEMVYNTMRKHCQSLEEKEREESAYIIRGKVPGKHGSWKEVSRFQEKVQGDLMKRLENSIIGKMKVPWTVSKIMRLNN
jgi:hypothetical protein